MVRPGRSQLNGCIEIDETYVGGTQKGGKRGRGAEKKDIVVIAIEVYKPKGFGRVRMRRIPDVSSESLVSFVNEVVEKNSIVVTDGWRGYEKLGMNGYTHNIKYLNDKVHLLVTILIIIWMNIPSASIGVNQSREGFFFID